MKLPRINRHFFIVLACIALIFTAGAYANKAWHSKVVQKQLELTKQDIITADRNRRQANEVAAEKAKLKAECDKEVSYYSALTAVQKTKTTAPTCQNLQIME